MKLLGGRQTGPRGFDARGSYDIVISFLDWLYSGPFCGIFFCGIFFHLILSTDDDLEP
jgi:hypothetical protein